MFTGSSNSSSNISNNSVSLDLSRTTATSGVKISAASISSANATPCINLIVEKHIWSKEQGEMLLDLYDENKEKFKNPAVRKIGVWSDIANKINSKFKTEFSPEQCHQKLRNFKNDFQKVMMLEKKDCRHFERLHKIFLQSAVKPSQSPAALKRKLNQLAGSKPENTGIPSQKKRKSGLPDFRSRAFNKNNPALGPRTENRNTANPVATGPQSVHISESYSYSIGGVDQYPRQSASFNPMLLAPRNFSSTSQQTTNTYQPPVESPKKLINGEATSMSYALPTMVGCSAGEVFSAGHEATERFHVKKTETEKNLNVSHIVPDTEPNGLPVPVYYYSNKNSRCIIEEPRGSESLVIALPPSSASVQVDPVQKPASKDTTPTTSSDKSALEIIQGLFENRKTKEAPKQTTNNQESTPKVAGTTNGERVREGHSQTVIDLTDGQNNDNLTRLGDLINKWRIEAQEMEKARIQREIDAEKRTDERHKETLLMTARFINLFEKMVSKITSSSD